MQKKSVLLSWILVFALFFAGNTSILKAQTSRDLTGSQINSLTEFYEPGSTSLVLQFETIVVSSDWESLPFIQMQFPDGITVTQATNMMSTFSVLSFNGETGNGALLSWGAIPGFWGNVLYAGDVATFTVDVNIAPDFVGDINIDYTLQGDGWGAPPNTINGVATVAVVPENAGIEFLTTYLEMGERPIGAWTKPASIHLINNPGKGDFIINNAEIDGNYQGFLEAATPETMPYVLVSGEESFAFGVKTTDAQVGAGSFSGSMVFFYGENRELRVIDYDGAAYLPSAGDVWENAFDINGITFPHSVSQADFRNNYELPGSTSAGWDVVYKIDTDIDVLANISLAADDAKMAVYRDGFNGLGGPDNENAVAAATTEAFDVPLFAGTNYLVVSTTGANYTLNLQTTTMPQPEAPVVIAPFDGATEVINGQQLEWAWGLNTLEYQLLLGTTYPPSTIVEDWTTANTTQNGSFLLENLAPNLQYFWQVNVRNNNGSKMGDVWGFTATITPPTGLYAEVVDEGAENATVAVNLSWQPNTNRAFLGYNVYRNGLKVNNLTVVSESFTDTEVPRNASFEYTVRALYDEGESANSFSAYIYTQGVGTLAGIVKDSITQSPISGARVLIQGDYDAHTVFTDVNGAFSQMVYAGYYTTTVSAPGYQDAGSFELIEHANQTTVNYSLLEQAFPVDFVYASELSEDEVLIEWGFNLNSFVPKHYPFPIQGLTAQQIEKRWNTFLAENKWSSDANQTADRAFVAYNVWRKKRFIASEMELVGTTTQTSYVDFEWGMQDWGVYEWYVEAVYDLQNSEPIASNSLSKAMNTTLTIAVNSNTGGAASGALVTLTNTSETDVDGAPIYVYSNFINNSGFASWDIFRKGIYNLNIELFGHQTISVSDLEIFEASELEYLLIEYVTPPTNLYVTPTALATWDAGAGHGGVGFEDFFEDFEAGIPEGWLVEYGVNATDPQNWKAVTIVDEWTPSINGTNFVKISSGDAGFYGGHVHGFLYTPEINTTGVDGLYLKFEQVYIHGGGLYSSLHGNVEVYDGSQWVVVLNQTSSQGNWFYPLYPEWGQGVTAIVDVSEYANPQFQVRFHYDDNNVWAYDWGIDNLSITSEMPEMRLSRDLVQYNVFLDGILVSSTDEEYYQHDVNDLASGQSYTTEVVAVYSTGQSEPESYTWTYIACDEYALAENFSAAQIAGTNNVELNWEWPEIDPEADQIAFGRIYRNDEVLVELTDVLSFTDENLAFGNYNYCLTLVYVSGAESCQEAVCAEVNVTGDAFVNGYVMQAEYLGGQAIEGANVQLMSQTNSFTFTTDEAGMYAGEVIGGLYNYTVSAEAYTTASLEGIEVPASVTITQDFVLDEFPSPALEVVAEEVSDDLVKISWRSPGSLLFEPILENFNNGMAPGWTIEDGGNTSDTWMWLTNYDNAFSLDDSPMMMVNSDAAGSNDVLMEEYLYSAVYNTNGAATLYLVFDQYYQQAGTGYASVEVFDGTSWVEVYTNAAAAGNWFAADQQQLDVTAYSNDQFQVRFFFTDNASWGFWWAIDNVLLTDMAVRNHTLLAPPQSTLQGYEVYRSSCYDTTEMELLGFVVDTNFFDYTWDNIATGVYKWAVKAVYAQNTSEPKFSNCLDKDMFTNVSVQLSTNSGDMPADAQIRFTNVSEPHLELVYETITDETGFYSWDSFRKGAYNIAVNKYGFLPISLEAFEITEPEAFNWTLEELLIPVSDLYVSPSAFASWVDGSVMPVFENEWTIHVFGNSFGDEISWELINKNGEIVLTGGNYGFQFDDTQIISVLSTEEPLTFVIETQGDFGDNTANYQLSCGGQLLYEDAILGSQEHTVEGLSCGNMAANRHTENFNGTTQRNPADFEHLPQQVVSQHQQLSSRLMQQRNGVRELQYFKVWLDGVFVTDTEDDFYQYSLDNLVSGQVYVSEVAAVYANGMSEKMVYEWTYIPCEELSGPQQYTAQIINEDDVLLSWSNLKPLELIKITQNPGTPSNAYFQQFGYGYGVAFDLSAYPDALINSFDFHHASWGTMGTWDYMVHIMNWDDRSLIATFGPYQTTANDTWETDIALADIPAMGADMLAILIEPLGNIASDAYPSLSSDNATNPQGSIFGPLNDLQAIGSSTIGNFLLELYINTAYGPARATPVDFYAPQAPLAKPKAAPQQLSVSPIISQQTFIYRSADNFVGTNLYRNGVLIAELLQDSTYLDMNVNGGDHTYCLRYVFESGAMTCEDAYCLDVSIACVEPENLEGQYYWSNENGSDKFGTLLRWEQTANFIEDWLYYDDGENVDGIGGPEAFQWAIKFDPDQLTDYEGTSLTKIQIFNRTQAADELRIYQGTDAATLVHSQTLSGLALNSWEEVALTEAVLIDVTQELWIVVYTTDGLNYPAACGNTSGQLNGELLSIDGVVWEYLSDYGLPYTWNLRGFVTTMAGVSMALPMDKPNDQFDLNTTNQLNISGLGSPAASKLPEVATSRALAVYNVYRSEYGENYEQIAAVPFDETMTTFEYFDDQVDAQQGYFYQLTAQYVYEDDTSCESAPALALENQDDDFVYVFVTAQQETASVNANIYPNPATNQLTIEANNMRKIVISNALGQVVYSGEKEGSKIILNTSNYKAGVYFVRLETSSGTSTKQLTIIK